MTDMTAAPVQGTAPLSTALDQGGAIIGGTGGGAVPLTPEAKPEPAPKPEDAGDTLRSELARIREEEAKEVKGKGEDAAKDAKAKLDDADKAKPEKVEKPVKADDDNALKEAKVEKEPADKAEKSDAEKLATGQEGDKSRPSEGQKRADPPARFLPKAKEHWVNVPHSVRDEVHRMADEHEAEVTKYRASAERYEPIRQFDEIAKGNGRELKDSLTKVVQVEAALARNPLMGLDMILQEMGPRKPDGSHFTLYEVAQHVAQMSPQQFSESMQGAKGQHQQAQAHQQTQTEVQQLREELINMRTEALAQSVIAPFAASHDRYHELQEDIEFFLRSGKIPASLSPGQKLEAAYDMAVRINPRSTSALQEAEAPVAAKKQPVDEAGSKSVRGAPSVGEDPDDDGEDATDIRKLLKREARKLAS